MDNCLDVVSSFVECDATAAPSAPAAPKRGRPAKVAPPAVAMLAAFLSGKRATARLVVSSDTAEGFSLVIGDRHGSIAIDYNGPSDRAFPQLLANHRATTPPDTVNPLQLSEGIGGAYPAAQLADALTCLESAASADVTRANLNGVHFDGADWVATDGHRLHRCEGMPVLFQTARTVPSWAVSVILKAIKWTRAESVTVSEGTIRPDAAFTVHGAHGSVTVTTQAVDAQFPAWRQVIPSGDGWSVLEGDASAMRAALKAAPIILDGGRFATSKKRHLAFSADGSVSAVAKDGARSDLPLSGYVKEPCGLWFAAPYIDEALDGINGAVVVKVDGYLSPMIIKSGDRSAIIMPMRG